MDVLYLFLCWLPAYVCAGIALWRKIKYHEHFEAIVFSILLLLVTAEGYFTGVVVNPETFTPLARRIQIYLIAFIIPLIYMFQGSSGGKSKFNISILQLLLPIPLLLIPALSLEMSPAYAHLHYNAPVYKMGVSVFYKGSFLFHVPWIAVVLLSQILTALQRVLRVRRKVIALDAHYSFTAKLVLALDFSCALLLLIAFAFVKEVWQTDLMQWSFNIISSIFIGISSAYIYLGFDLNPVSENKEEKFSLNDFVHENADLIKRFRKLLEEDEVYLEANIQAEEIIQRLKTNTLYFDHLMQGLYKCNFTEYVHKNRIKFAKKHLQEMGVSSPNDLSKKELTKLSIACGYSSESTFMSIYDRITANES